MPNTIDVEIKEMLRLGEDPEVIAEIMGVSLDYVCDIAEQTS